MKIIFGNPTAEMILEAQRNEDERKRLSGAAVLAKTTARLGLVVCPVDPMTGPIHQDFEARATSDPDEVEKLWQGAPNALVGLPCSRNNVTVLHARGGQGVQSLNRLAARYGCFPRMRRR